ncbi:hypothetical protein [Flavobacterium suzhouense]|uniref:Natural product n=1 Tax=Flavobacterium suzhouense TaxID=1529638 RepID=A0ABW5NX51_9FLAO
MEKLNSKLFESLKLTDKEAQNLTGGSYTSSKTDTSTQTNQYDVIFKTVDKNGSNPVLDTDNTGSDSLDKPTNGFTLTPLIP